MINGQGIPLSTGAARSRALALAAVFVACGEAPGAGPTPPLHTVPSCAASGEAPLQQSDGMIRCRPVGAVATAATAAPAWPDAAGAMAPVVYVSFAGGPDAPGGGMTYRTLDAALAATPPPATVLLARGRHPLGQTVNVTGSLALRGAGAGATVLVGPASGSALRVAVEVGARRAVTVDALSIEAGAGATGLEASGEGAQLRLRNVTVEGGADGVTVSGATLCANGFTVRRAQRRALYLADGARGFLENVLVREGGGVRVQRSALTLRAALVAGARDGISLQGGVTGGLCTGDAACPAQEPCEGFTYTQRCAESFGLAATAEHPAIPGERRCRGVHVLERVTILDSGVTGLRIGRSEPTTEESRDYVARNTLYAAPGAIVRVARLVVAGTRVPPGLVGGDGVYLGAGASMEMDGDIASESMMGRGSVIVGNARVGILVDGDRSVEGGPIPQALLRAARLDAAGLLVGSNAGPGIYVQRNAVVERLRYSLVEDNTAAGFAATEGGTLGLGQCDQFLGTRPGTIRPEGIPPFAIADGLTLAERTSSRGAPETILEDSVFSGNARFGLLFSGYDATLRRTGAGNRGSGNRFGVGVYGNSRVMGDLASIQGAQPAPGIAQSLRSGVSPPMP